MWELIMGKGAKEIIINLEIEKSEINKDVEYGDAFVTNGDIFIVTQVNPDKFLLISLEDGNRYFNKNIIDMKVYEVARLLRESYEDYLDLVVEVKYVKNYSLEIKGESVIV